MRKVLIKNFFSLVSVQFANYILPLVTLPYLARVVGVEKFGLIAFAQAIITYFVIITTFGFNLYAPKQISIIREDREKTRAVFWNILYSQLLLCIFSAMVMTLLIWCIPGLKGEATLLWFTFAFVLGNILFPTWYFQGIEKMVYIAILNFIVKLIYTFSIFIFIKTADNYAIVPLLFSVSQIIIGIMAMAIVMIHFGITPIPPRFGKIYRTLKDSAVLFASNISINIYTKIHPIILGSVWGSVYVGYYSAAEKIFNACIQVQQQLSATLYPHISRIAQDKKKGEHAINFIRKAFVASLALAIPAAFFVFIFADPIISFLYGHNFAASVSVMKIFAILFVVVGVNYSLGVQAALPLSMEKEFLKAAVFTGLASICLSAILIPLYGYNGAGLSYLGSEVVQGILLYYFLLRRGVSIIDFNYRKVEAYEQ